MAEDTKYEYRRHEASLLRAPADAKWRREIFRPRLATGRSTTTRAESKSGITGMWSNRMPLAISLSR